MQLPTAVAMLVAAFCLIALDSPAATMPHSGLSQRPGDTCVPPAESRDSSPCTCDNPQARLTVLVDPSTPDAKLQSVREWLVTLAKLFTSKLSPACPPSFSLLSDIRSCRESGSQKEWLDVAAFRARAQQLRPTNSFSRSEPSAVINTLEAVVSASQLEQGSALCNTGYLILVVTHQSLMASDLPPFVQQNMRVRMTLVTSINFPVDARLPVPVLGRHDDTTIFTLPTNGRIADFRTIKPSRPRKPAVPRTLADELLDNNGSVFAFQHILDGYEQRCALATSVAHLLANVSKSARRCCGPFYPEAQSNTRITAPSSARATDPCSCRCTLNCTFTEAPSSSVDIAFIMDKRLVQEERNYTWLSTLVGDHIEPFLLQNGVGSRCANHYTMALFHAGYQSPNNGSHANYLGNRSDTALMTAEEFRRATSSLTKFTAATQLLHTNNGCGALVQALRYIPFRRCRSVAENIILFTDEGGEQACFPTEHRFQEMRRLISGYGFTFNVIIDRRLGAYDGRQVLGIDAHHVAFVVEKPRRKQWMAMTKVRNGVNRTKKRSYVRLAMELGGAVWDIQAVQRGGLSRMAFAQAFSDGLRKQMRVCRKCFCRQDDKHQCALQYIRRTLNKDTPTVRKRC